VFLQKATKGNEGWRFNSPPLFSSFPSVGTIRHQPVCGRILQILLNIGKTVPEETFPDIWNSFAGHYQFPLLKISRIMDFEVVLRFI